MFLTLTLNPCIDLSLDIDTFAFDRPLRALGERKRAGGKGMNVAVTLATLGFETIAVAPLGGHTGEEYSDLAAILLETLPARLESPRIPGETRTNIVAASRTDGRHLKINQRGPALTSDGLQKVLATLDANARRGDCLVLSGGLPPGASEATYAVLGKRYAARGCQIVLDAEGEAFRQGLSARPYVVKPNRQELETFAARPLETERDILGAARETLDAGARICLVSDGPRPAYLITRDFVLRGAPPPAEGPSAARAASGAGDAMLAGFLAGHYGWGAERTEIGQTVETLEDQAGPTLARDLATLRHNFALALACGSAAATMPDTVAFRIADLNLALRRQITTNMPE